MSNIVSASAADLVKPIVAVLVIVAVTEVLITV